MKRSLGGALLLSFGIWSAAFGANACSSGSDVSRPCTAIGCDSSETLTFSVPEPTFTEADVEVCRNDQCWHAPLQLNQDGQPSSLILNNGLPGVILRIEPIAEGLRVSADFQLNQYAEVVVGDVLKVSFSDANGAPLFAVSGTTRTYFGADSYPNGRECDRFPCRQATAEITDP